MSKINTQYTKKELDFLKEHYSKQGIDWCSKRINRTRNSIRNIAYRKKIKVDRKVIVKLSNLSKQNNGKPRKKLNCQRCNISINPYSTRKRNLCLKCSWIRNWTDEELKILEKYYGKITVEKLMIQLPNKREAQIRKKGHKKGWRIGHKFRSITTKKRNLLDNVSKRPEVREKNSKRMKEFIRNNPDKMLNRLLKRNKITSLEKRVKRILDKNNISYKYNHYVKTKDSYKFPDFRVGKLIIECDGDNFHKDKAKDTKRDKELIEVGYEILHFSENKINKNLEVVEKCILKKLKQLNIQENRKLMI